MSLNKLPSILMFLMDEIKYIYIYIYSKYLKKYNFNYIK